ncbi:arylsulfatase [Saccharopolyspora sp. NPDC049357]|uniref:arylsulfatase n=1 Tax=Saccharopolyspora sp. NPDC049357 TaxID=3154507 RepID=UPI00342A0D4B
MGEIKSSGYPHRGYERFTGVVDELASRSRPAWKTPRRAAKGAPNVVVILMDDMGFSDISPFGSEIDTPHLAKLAQNGYRFTNYQTAPVCSPARAALLTGLNPHRAGFWSVAHSDPGYPGAALEIGSGVPTLADNFRAAGYATFMVGKWHLTKESNLHDGADKASWPLQRGFDRYYGCMDGFTSLHHPHRIIEDNHAVPIDEYPDGYFLTDDLTAKALDMVTGLRASDPDRPFFLYYAHQAVHGPLQAKNQDIERYRGHYDEGWDVLREERFRRQLRDGLFPSGTKCASRNVEPGFDVPEWDRLNPEERSLYARYMEVYAAAIDNVDQNLGRLMQTLADLGELDNTMFIFTSDNGATGEGGPSGTRSYFSHFGQKLEMPDHWLRDAPRDPDLIGGPRTHVHYPRGWAYASNSPFRLYKAHAYAGGVRVPFILSWPSGLRRSDGDDGVRDQFAYVSDVGQTLMELAGVTQLKERHGIKAPAPDGVSFAEVLRERDAASSHSEQYTEYQGRRAYVRDEWKVVTQKAFGPDWDEDPWRLYNVTVDPAETTDLSDTYPALTAELAERWKAAAWMNTVFPLNDDGSMLRQRPSSEAVLEQPVFIHPKSPTLERFRSSKLVKLRCFDIVASGSWGPEDRGVLVSHGDQGGGYSVYLDETELWLSYNEYGTIKRISVPAQPHGYNSVTVRFSVLPEYQWRIVLEHGDSSAELSSVLQLCGMAPFTGISVGADRAGPVDWDIYVRHGSFPFTGELDGVRYYPGPKADYNPEHLVEIDRMSQTVYE